MFENIFEAGAVLFAIHRVSLSWNHYSNAHFAEINHNATVFHLSYPISR
jgi:hypothetical protein